MSARPLSRHAPRADIALWRRILVSDTALLVGLALVKLVAHLLVAWNYGYFRDELYYIDAGRHLAPGYVDFPPFVAVLAAITRLVSGNALVALHVWPAVAGALLVLLTGLMARELGGGRFAQGLAALATLVTLTFLVLDSLFTMDAWDELWWALAAYVWIRLIRRNQPRLWLLFGLVAGIGLFTKLTMLAFGFALTIGLLLTPSRTVLRSRWPWLGAAIALLFLLPYLLWNAANGWSTPQFWSNYGHHTIQVSPLDFFVEQSYTMTPLTLPLWLAGLWYLFFTAQGKPYRALGWAFVVLYVLFSAAQAKSYFLSPAYPMLFAAGAIVFERGLRGSWRWVRPVYAALLLRSGLVLAPAALPVLPRPRTATSTSSSAVTPAPRRSSTRWGSCRSGWPTAWAGRA